MKQMQPAYRGAVAIVYLCMFFEGGGNILLSATKEALMEHFGVGLVQISLLFTVRSIACGLIPFLTGGLSDRLGRKKLILMGTAVLALYYAAVPVLPTFPLMLGMICLYGAGYSMIDPSAQSILFDRFENPAPYMPFVQVAFAFGSILIPLAVSLGVQHGAPWQWLYYGYGALAVALGLFTLSRRFPPPVRSRPPREEGREAAPRFAVPPHPMREGLAAFLLIFFANMSTAAIGNWADVYMRDVFGYGDAAAVRVLSVFQVGCVAGALLTALLARRVPAPVMLSVGSLTGLVFYAAAAHMPTPGLFMAAVLGTALFAGSLFSVVVGYVGQLFRENAGATVGAICSASSIGIALSSLITGALAQAAGIRMVLMVMPVALAAGAVCALYLLRRHRVLAGQ